MPRFLLILLVFASLTAAAQGDDDYAYDRSLKYDDYIYSDNIRTVQFHETTWDYAPPVLKLGGPEQLELSFDDLDGDRKSYTATFVHCNADWTPSDLMISEYLNGFFEINIINYTFATNTLQKYTHYSLVFPTAGGQSNIQFTKSGNYLLYVFANGEKKNIVLCRRFMVYDQHANISTTFKQAVGGGEQYNKQHIDFNITPAGYEITNPYRDLKVVLMQNNRWENAVTDIKPTFLAGQQLIYSLDDASTFNGGNEFRYFDVRSLRFLTERVKDIYRDKDMKMHAVLHPDVVRANRAYIFYNDFNGNYLIRNRESSGNMDSEADYVYVDFFLPYPSPESTGNFYIMGKLTDWRMTRQGKMTYNYERGGYEARLYLKQGYYNYIYVLSNDNIKGGNEKVVEGSHWDTENDYTILVYHRKFGTYYDQLIGYSKFNSLAR